MACTRPTRCWSWCSADQSARPVAAAGTVPATPAAISTAAARSVPRNRSSSTAEVQQPSGSRTSAGCAGWPNGTPCSASVRGPAGSARTTESDRPRTTGSRAWARSMRSASAAGRDSRAPLRALPARRVVWRRDCRTSRSVPAPAPPTRRAAPVKIAAQPGQLVAHDVLEPPLEVEQQPQLLVRVAGRGVAPRPDQRPERGPDLAQPGPRVQRDDHPAPVLRVALPPDEAPLLQPVEHPGDRRRGQPGRPGQLARRHRPGQRHDVQAVQVRHVDPDPLRRHLPEQLHDRPVPPHGQQELPLQPLPLRTAPRRGLPPSALRPLRPRPSRLRRPAPPSPLPAPPALGMPWPALLLAGAPACYASGYQSPLGILISKNTRH